MSFNHVLPFPREIRQFRVTLKELESRINDRATLILLPICGTDDGAGVWSALRIAGRARLRTLYALLFKAAVFDNGQRVMLAVLVDAVHPRREGVGEFGPPRELRHLWLTGEIDFETILRADVQVPFLGCCGHRNRH